jgi:NitT/TauT family transport system substrate-binding protein
MAKRSVLFPSLLCWIVAVGLLAGCTAKKSANGLTQVKFQTDWYPQPEQGGFYNALVKGYYKDEGLDVVIVPGGPYLNAEQQVATNSAQFGMGSSDRLLEAVSNEEPLIAVGATMQHDPQAIMVHDESSVHTFADLEGHAVAVKAGSTWFSYLVKRYKLENVREVPATYSVSNFLEDPTYIQQIFVTSEPFFARKAGARIRTLLISGTGYDPYRIFFTSTSFLKDHPELVEKFVRASLRGWKDYLIDPVMANAAISKLNPAMNQDQMQFTYQALKEGKFVTGDDPSQLGQFDPARWTSMYQQLLALTVLKKPIDPTSVYTLNFLHPAPGK